MASTEDTLELYYFPVFAKVGSLFALEHSGLKWQHKLPGDWGSMKSELSWGCLPVLKNLPAQDSASFGSAELGQEVAILNYIANKAGEKMKGVSISEEAVSQQLLGVGEDIYQQLGKIKNKLSTPEQAVIFWTKDKANAAVHNRNFSIHVYLDQLEKFLAKTPYGKQGKFTSSGVTVGECKLFASLHACKWAQDSVFSGYEGLSMFYDRFSKEPATQAILNGDKTEAVLSQYFYLPEGVTA